MILNDCFMDEKVSPIAIAQIGQWAENVYFGKPCGLMDQLASSTGGLVFMDFRDPAAPPGRRGGKTHWRAAYITAAKAFATC